MRRRRINQAGWSAILAGAILFTTGVGAGVGLAGQGNASVDGFQTTEFVAMKTVPLDVELQKHVYQIAQEYGLDWTLLLAVMQKESHFKPYTVSDSGDYGLMQINRINFSRLSVEAGVNDFLDPRENVRAGAYLLSQLMGKYQDPNMALMAYNMGESGAAEFWEKGIYTSAYSREVINIQRELKRVGKEITV